jgi:hypothetical protein
VKQPFERMRVFNVCVVKIWVGIPRDWTEQWSVLESGLLVVARSKWIRPLNHHSWTIDDAVSLPAVAAVVAVAAETTVFVAARRLW